MKKFFSLFLVVALMGVASQVMAQGVYACEDYDKTTGKPIGEGSVWNIEPSGGFVYLLYNNNGRRINDEMIFFFIDKKKGGSYEEYDTKTATPEGKYALLDYKFTEAGDYKVTIYNADVEELASTTLTIKFKGSTSSTTNTSSGGGSGNTDTYYYSNSKVVFCEEVKDNKPVNEATSFTIPKDGGYLTVQVDNGKALKTTQLIVDIYKKPKGGSDYTEFVETKRYDIKETWDRPYFSYTFYTKGEYKLAIYNADETWINTGYVTINQR